METPEKDEPAKLISDAEYLRMFLHERDVECPLCQYNLRGQTAGRCPECGRELQLSVGLTEPFLRAWITLSVITFATAGIGLLFFGLLITDGHPPRRVLPVILYFVIAGPLLAVFTIFKRRSLLRLSVRVQWVIAAIIGAASTIAVVAFFALLR